MLMSFEIEFVVTDFNDLAGHLTRLRIPANAGAPA
jgi:hypothetical protein